MLQYFVRLSVARVSWLNSAS